MARYRVTHHYLTLDDDGNTVVEVETHEAQRVEDVAPLVEEMLAFPGGRSGTTVALQIAALDAVRV